MPRKFLKLEITFIRYHEDKNWTQRKHNQMLKIFSNLMRITQGVFFCPLYLNVKNDIHHPFPLLKDNDIYRSFNFVIFIF